MGAAVGLDTPKMVWIAVRQHDLGDHLWLDAHGPEIFDEFSRSGLMARTRAAVDQDHIRTLLPS
jgi:hypothetical protein